MQPFYVVREITKSDNFACQSLVKTYIMSFVNEAFWSCLFREVSSMNINVLNHLRMSHSLDNVAANRDRLGVSVYNIGHAITGVRLGGSCSDPIHICCY